MGKILWGEGCQAHKQSFVLSLSFLSLSRRSHTLVAQLLLSCHRSAGCAAAGWCMYGSWGGGGGRGQAGPGQPAVLPPLPCRVRPPPNTHHPFPAAVLGRRNSCFRAAAVAAVVVWRNAAAAKWESQTWEKLCRSPPPNLPTPPPFPPRQTHGEGGGAMQPAQLCRPLPLSACGSLSYFALARFLSPQLRLFSPYFFLKTFSFWFYNSLYCVQKKYFFENKR